MVENPGSGRLESLLQTAVQSVQWTYSLFWKLCPHNGMLVWSDGYYNGAIKTRKTVQGTEVSAEEASLHRSQQIKELYDSLSATAAEESKGGGQQPARRPSAALSPEDLTESEWFYLMCISFSFPAAVGLPGKAYAKRHHIWLTGANEVESKVFSRAILAKSARIQTVVCIPLMDGVVELGTTERVKEDYEFIQHIKNHFMEPHHHHHHPKPALSEHSSSEPPSLQLHPPVMASGHHHHRQVRAEEEEEVEEEEEEEDEEEEEEEEEDEDEAEELESDADVGPKNHQTSDHVMAAAEEEEEEQNINAVVNNVKGVVAASELMQFDMSESIRVGTPDDASTDLDSDFHLLPQIPHCQNPTLLSHQGAPMLEEFSREDTHYSETIISSILRHQCGQWSELSTTVAGDHVVHSASSAFSRWTTAASSTCSSHRSAQWILKYTLLTVPFLHANNSHDAAATIPASKLCKAAPQEEPNANHVLAERRRREKLNERFIILRSLVPFVTKMDKASILGDTIEYVKQLRRRIQELEAARGSPSEVGRQSITGGVTRKNPAQKSGASRTQMGPCRLNKKGTRTAERGGRPANDTEEDAVVQVEVSIIECDALVELRCTYREGLILDVMQMLRELGLEITTVQSSVNGGFFCAELRAKLKENLKGRKATIMEVKKALHSIIPQF